ncbi:MAG: deoxyguanosinetriphosphate triphosphohydrolase [Deltaproteobacteria bacterium]
MAKGLIYEFEEKLLAPYAMKSSLSKGRRYFQPEHEYRSAYQRDRDRVIHSQAFRLLEYKTQVFVNHEGDYYRTRLTHTLEVAQIARTIAFALRLNPDLTEAIALAHDLGHTPFGHAGEDTLNELMAGHGGFNHNLHGLRVVEKLEDRYPGFTGLNLTWEVREGLVKHRTKFDRSAIPPEFEPDKKPTLETQIVDIADEIAYDNHDLDDGITSGLLEEADLEKLTLWKRVKSQIPPNAELSSEKRKYLMIRNLIDLQVTDLKTTTEEKLRTLNLKTPEDVRSVGEKIVSFSPEMEEERKPLRELLQQKLYRHYRVARMTEKATRCIQELFRVYSDKPEALPPKVQERIAVEGLHRGICDYIAGMTDRNALDEYKKLFDPYEKV